ncbi:ubiquitin carboxyl-terminal hydrolase 20 [Onthophagus taurus]|uniref:ubiquitin carboxyl-terminal hydrolase 20 n=1 Tax=Onthophagus taurus TaxID=166361 RepID=UPI000C20A1FA|nr:ubiquitin carboxyl-terminal hydrolase 20 [Onthophagus taurus]XP_022900543.1 ubiquitin carboxyl-terminal hydrolase 20 [Onthophagus taurus]
MSCKVAYSQTSCPHLRTTTDIPLHELLKHAEKIQCADCECTGPNLWICLQHDCLKIGCSEQSNDHNTLHNASNPSHCVHMNLTTHRIWCYECKREVFLRSSRNGETNIEGNGDQDPKNHHQFASQTDDFRWRIGNGGFDRVVGMGGDTSESSDAEDSSIVPTPSSSKPQGLVGLQNIGNTCYLNAALQALSNTTPLTKFFLDCASTVLILSDGRKPGLSRTYQMLVKDMWLNKNGGYINPQGILYGIRNVYPMFRGYQQHDTQEFLRNFMDQLHEELKQVAVPDVNPLDLDMLSGLVTEDTAVVGGALGTNNNYDSIESSEGEYETCDSGVSERSSLSDDNERPTTATQGASSIPKRRSSRSMSPSRRLRAKLANSVIEIQPSSSPSSLTNNNKKQIKYKSIISDIFDGKLLSTVQCLTCNRVSSRIETFQDLSLPIPSRDHLAVIHGRNVVAATPGVGSTTCSEAVLPVDNGWITWIVTWLKSWFYGPTITLHDCLAAFFSTDELKGDNMYSCERCNKLRNGIKYSKVLQLPEVLCIHLKRFRHELMFSSKISSTVSFPLKGLDMKPYLHADCSSQVTTYELFSVICHHGTAGGGHYMCYALNNGQWYEFDDQYVTRVSSETVGVCEAYVLFYRKVPVDVESVLEKMKDLQDNAVGIQEEECYYISKQWLSRFFTCAEPGPIDNRDFLCQHGLICPDQGINLDQLATAVPKKVYTFLFRKYGGHPASPTTNVCPTCHALLTRLVLEMQTLKQLNLQSQEQDVQATHLLPKSWYQNWLAYVQRITIDPPGPIDNSKATEYLNEINSDFAEVSEDIWNFFYSIYGGGPEIRINNVKDEEEEIISEENKSVLIGGKSANHIDKKMYCRGEPMETESETDNINVSMITDEVCQENGSVKENGEDVDGFNDEIQNHNMMNGNVSNTSLTDDEVTELVNVKKSKSYNRRKKRDNF